MKVGFRTYFSPRRYKEEISEYHTLYSSYYKMDERTFFFRKHGPANIDKDLCQYLRRGIEYRIDGPTCIFTDGRMYYTDLKIANDLSEEEYWNH